MLSIHITVEAFGRVTARALRQIALVLLFGGVVGCVKTIDPVSRSTKLSVVCEKVACGNRVVESDIDTSWALHSSPDGSLYGVSVFTRSGDAVPTQWVDADQDGKADKLLFKPVIGNSDYYLSEKNSVETQKRVNITLSVREGGDWIEGKLEAGEFQDKLSFTTPKDHKPGNRLLRMEGPAWESEYVGYRLYLDHRNGLDIFGKRDDKPVLSSVGYDNSNYHQMNDWGADLLKVGDSLGIGSVGLWENGGAKRLSAMKGSVAQILENGPLSARLRVKTPGIYTASQAFDIGTEYQINSGSRLTQIHSKADRLLSSWVTGLVKHQAAQLIVSDEDQEWSYIATYGNQSVFDDALGMVIFFKSSEAKYAGEDDLNHVVKFRDERKDIRYFMGAVWAQDVQGINSRSEFKAYIERERLYLSNPPKVKTTQ